MSDPKLSYLGSVFFFWHVETLLSVALASVHPTDCAGSEKEVLLVLPALYCMYCLWISVIRFLISVIRFLALFIDFPPVIIRDAEYLVLWPFVDCFFFIFFLKLCEENVHVATGILKVGCVWNLFLQYPPQDLSPGAAVISSPTGLVIGGAESKVFKL